MFYSYYKSPIGLIEIKATEEHLLSVEFAEKIRNVETENWVTKECGKQLNEYFLGKREEFRLPIKLEGTQFQQKVWQELCKIEYGKVSTYQQIAKKIGNVKAVRAVGTAIGKNPIAIIVPCHRVIGSNGSMTGYAYGVDKKEKLLHLEAKEEGFFRIN